MASKKNKGLVTRLRRKAMKVSFKIKYQQTGLLEVVEQIQVRRIISIGANSLGNSSISASFSNIIIPSSIMAIGLYNFYSSSGTFTFISNKSCLTIDSNVFINCLFTSLSIFTTTFTPVLDLSLLISFFIHKNNRNKPPPTINNMINWIINQIPCFSNAS